MNTYSIWREATTTSGDKRITLVKENVDKKERESFMRSMDVYFPWIADDEVGIPSFSTSTQDSSSEKVAN
jgi:UPF0288 family protein (methanogenesis marker protein 3)